MPLKIAINGFGRIGRAFFKIACEHPEIKIVAINDLGEAANLAYLLKYDSVYKKWNKDITVEPGGFRVCDQSVKFIQEKDPTKLPWKNLDIDIVVESSGFYETFEKSKQHLTAGAKRVVISAPAKDDDQEGVGQTVLMGINENALSKCKISSNGSCTTNSSHPVIEILNSTVGIQKAMLTTIHSYTATQKLIDGPDHGDWRRGRAAAVNIVPSTTGAAISVTRVIQNLKGLFDGLAIRVPSIAGSISDITLLTKNKTTKEDLIRIFKTAEKDKRWNGIFKTTDEELISGDILSEPYASILDCNLIKVVDGDLIKILAWYDNEMGYTYTLLKHVIQAGNYL